jgi:cytochrome oxidase Cu insertion factor (SCO1/SenC/PrrC family)
MNRRRALLAAGAAAALAGLAPSASAQNAAPPKTHLKAGDMAPDFELPSTAGGKVKLSDLRGKKNVVLAFFPAAFTGG